MKLRGALLYRCGGGPAQACDERSAWKPQCGENPAHGAERAEWIFVPGDAAEVVHDVDVPAVRGDAEGHETQVEVGPKPTRSRRDQTWKTTGSNWGLSRPTRSLPKCPVFPTKAHSSTSSCGPV